MMPLEQAVVTARTILNTGGTWRECMEATGKTEWQLRCAMDPTYRERKNERSRQWRTGGVFKRATRPPRAPREKVGSGHVATSVTVPQQVLFERERALLAPRTLTAAICGDPVPGRSALGRRRG